jgi:hypothetical protein
VREEHTERLKQGFIKVVQKEKEFERQLQVQQREEQLMQQKLAEQQRQQQQQQQIMEVGPIAPPRRTLPYPHSHTPSPDPLSHAHTDSSSKKSWRWVPLHPHTVPYPHSHTPSPDPLSQTHRQHSAAATNHGGGLTCLHPLPSHTPYPAPTLHLTQV